MFENRDFQGEIRSLQTKVFSKEIFLLIRWSSEV